MPLPRHSSSSCLQLAANSLLLVAHSSQLKARSSSLIWASPFEAGITPVAYFSCMKIVLCSIGKPHEAYIKQGVEDFTKRINNYFTTEWLLVPPPKNAASLPEGELKKQEARLVISLLQQDDFLVLLDERGRQITSPQLAQLLQQKANESSKRIVFLIGGAYGVDDTVFKRANYTLSLSQMVFPHMLVRLVLAEQVYRACTILRNEKYHHM